MLDVYMHDICLTYVCLMYPRSHALLAGFRGEGMEQVPCVIGACTPIPSLPHAVHMVPWEAAKPEYHERLLSHCLALGVDWL